MDAAAPGALLVWCEAVDEVHVLRRDPETGRLEVAPDAGLEHGCGFAGRLKAGFPALDETVMVIATREQVEAMDVDDDRVAEHPDMTCGVKAEELTAQAQTVFAEWHRLRYHLPALRAVREALLGDMALETPAQVNAEGEVREEYRALDGRARVAVAVEPELGRALVTVAVRWPQDSSPQVCWAIDLDINTRYPGQAGAVIAATATAALATLPA